MTLATPERKTLVAGGHEQAQTVYKSTDGGQTWTNIGANLPAGTGFSSAPIVINSQTYVVNTNASWGGGSGGVYRTTNGGTTWQKVASVNVIGNPLITAAGTFYWQVGQYSSDHLLKSSDKGVTWSEVGSGLTAVTPVELPDGRLVSSNGSKLVVSNNGGQTWTAFGANLPYNPAGIIYSQARNSFMIWHWDCGGIVLPDAIMKLE